MELFRAVLCIVVICSVQALDTTDPTEMITSILMKAMKATSGSRTRERITRSTSSDLIPFPSFDAYLQCRNVAAAAECDSGLQQEIFSIAERCGQDDIALAARYNCGINSDGLYCANGVEFLSQYSTQQRDCYQNIGNGCLSTCRDAILSLRDRLGCCAGFWTDTFRSQSNIFDRLLWDVCNVVPGELCEIPSFPTQVPPGTFSFCSTEVATLEILTYRCTYPNSQAIVDAYENTDNCSSLANASVEACSIDEDGGFCSLKTDISSFINVFNECTLSLRSTSCSSSCATSLTSLRGDFGCCLNSIFNGTLAKVHPDSSIRVLLPYLSYDLWSRCGVDPPGCCDSLHMPPVTPTPIMTPIMTPTAIPTTLESRSTSTSASIGQSSSMSTVATSTTTSASTSQPTDTPNTLLPTTMSPTPITPPPTTSQSTPVNEPSSGACSVNALSIIVILASIFVALVIHIPHF